MTVPPTWRKSSRSTSTSTCVEVANTLGAVRDSKNPDGPKLTVGVTALVEALRSGQI